MDIKPKEYHTSKWKQLRDKVFARDGYKCTRCGRTEKLQAHHIYYRQGKKAWDYPIEALITYCQGCHAEVHGHVMPKSGWTYCGMDDLEDLVGECELCGSALRYEHEVYHENWGYMVVGSQCADKLTSTVEASEYEEKIKKNAKRLERYLYSSRWKIRGNRYSITLDGYGIDIFDNSTHFTIRIRYTVQHALRAAERKSQTSQKRYSTLEEAKIKAFQVITSGELENYLRKKGLLEG